MVGFPGTVLILAVNMVITQAFYCTFYSDDKCTSRVGSVNYEAGNKNCFFNSGQFIKCDTPGIQYGIEQYPRDQCGGTPKGYFGFDGFCTNIAAIAKKGYQYKLRPSGVSNTRDRRSKRTTSDESSGSVGTLPIARMDVPWTRQGPGKPISKSLASMNAQAKAALEKRNDKCYARIEFYYGGQCTGPAAVYEEEVPFLSRMEADYVSPCHNDGLYGRYVLTRSTCDLVVWEGENCSGKSANTFTTSLSCSGAHHKDFTIRSWQWSCAVNSCNDQFLS